MKAYPLVNAGRKILETFLDFKYPSNPDKFEQLKNAKVQATGEVFEQARAELLYGLLNDGSHAGFDTGGFDTFRNSPEIIKRAIEALLDFIEAIDPVHYRNVCKCDGIKARTKSAGGEAATEAAAEATAAAAGALAAPAPAVDEAPVLEAKAASKPGPTGAKKGKP
ncbi:MAG: hypothetical protein KKA05_03130 [Alphaproteobacteria bacterium]|nr:hypothetical protein [Alphaproteobacteria bacterium]MBU0859870.1 hypothetical protein [Alphaproteobacteria bacterium]